MLNVFCFLQVKEALAVLIIQNMASFRVNEKAGGITEYSCIIGNVVSRIRFEKYVLFVKKRHGDIAELVLNELLLHGQMTVNQIVQSVIEKLGTDSKCLISIRFVLFFVICVVLIKSFICNALKVVKYLNLALHTFNVLKLLVGRLKGHPAYKIAVQFTSDFPSGLTLS